jgi:phage FluMu protein Com
MPIRFRCSYCNRLLGIATRKAGTRTICPHCTHAITVPQPEGEPAATGPASLDDVADLLERSAPRGAPAVEDRPRVDVPATAAPVVVTKPVPTPTSRPAPSENVPDDRPLFEGDVDAILGAPPEPEKPETPHRPATSGMDALNLGEPAAQVTLSAKKATLLVVVVVVLLALAFAAGVFLSPRG